MGNHFTVARTHNSQKGGLFFFLLFIQIQQKYFQCQKKKTNIKKKHNYKYKFLLFLPAFRLLSA